MLHIQNGQILCSILCKNLDAWLGGKNTSDHAFCNLETITRDCTSAWALRAPTSRSTLRVVTLIYSTTGGLTPDRAFPGIAILFGFMRHEWPIAASYARSRWQTQIGLEGLTTQTPTPLNRPRQPHQNFDDFLKSLEKSKNFIYYKEYSNYHEYHVIFAKLC